MSANSPEPQLFALKVQDGASLPHSMGRGGKKVLTSKFRYVSIDAMHAQRVSLTQTAIRHFDGLSLRTLNLLGLASLLALLILSQGAGSG